MTKLHRRSVRKQGKLQARRRAAEKEREKLIDKLFEQHAGTFISVGADDPDVVIVVTGAKVPSKRPTAGYTVRPDPHGRDTFKQLARALMDKEE